VALRAEAAELEARSLPRLAVIRYLVYSIYGKSDQGDTVGYEDIRVTDELDGGVQRAVGVSPRRHETLGELVKDIAVEHWVPRLANLLSAEPTRHQVRVNGRILHTFCFVDALMHPFVLQRGAVEMRSAIPTGGELAAVVTEEGVEGWPRGVVVSFGAARSGEGTICETLCPYLNVFVSRADYDRWVRETPKAETVALSMEEAFDLARDWASGGSDGPKSKDCHC
jgi:alkylmercury lyase